MVVTEFSSSEDASKNVLNGKFDHGSKHQSQGCTSQRDTPFVYTASSVHTVSQVVGVGVGGSGCDQAPSKFPPSLIFFQAWPSRILGSDAWTRYSRTGHLRVGYLLLV